MTELKEHMSFFERQDWSIPIEFTELCVAAESKDEKLRKREPFCSSAKDSPSLLDG